MLYSPGLKELNMCNCQWNSSDECQPVSLRTAAVYSNYNELLTDNKEV